MIDRFFLSENTKFIVVAIRELDLSGRLGSIRAPSDGSLIPFAKTQQFGESSDPRFIAVTCVCCVELTGEKSRRLELLLLSREIPRNLAVSKQS